VSCWKLHFFAHFRKVHRRHRHVSLCRVERREVPHYAALCKLIPFSIGLFLCRWHLRISIRCWNPPSPIAVYAIATLCFRFSRGRQNCQLPLLRQNQYRETEESHFLRHTKNISKRKGSTRRAERESISSQHNSLCHLGRRESEELGRKRASFFIPPKTPTRLQRKFHFGQLMRNANWAPPVASWVSAGYLRLT
jgi:hypothetical protein